MFLSVKSFQSTFRVQNPLQDPETSALTPHPALLATIYFSGSSAGTNYTHRPAIINTADYSNPFPQWEIESTMDTPRSYLRAIKALENCTLGNDYQVEAVTPSQARRQHRLSSSKAFMKYFIKESAKGVRLIQKESLALSDHDVRIAAEKKLLTEHRFPVDQERAITIIKEAFPNAPTDLRYFGLAATNKTKFLTCSTQGRLFAVHIKETFPIHNPERKLVQLEVEYKGSKEPNLQFDTTSLDGIKKELRDLRDQIAVIIGIVPSQIRKSSKRKWIAAV